jgi:hypothetical protein
MLSDHERKTLGQIQVDLTESDPEFVRGFAVGGLPRADIAVRGAYLIWIIAATAGLLNILSLAIGLTAGAFLFATIALSAIACDLWWSPLGARHQGRRTSR